MLASLVVAVGTIVEPTLHVTSSAHAARLLPAALLTPEQIETTPVWSLNGVQLESEASRLAGPLPVAPWGTTLAVGGGGFLLFGALSSGCLYAGRGIGFFILGLATGAVAFAGLVFAVVGGVMVLAKIVQREAYAERLGEVRARLGAISAREQGVSSVESGETWAQHAEVAALENEKPGLGLPILLMIGGAAVAVVGLVDYVDKRNSPGSDGVMHRTLGIGSIIAGLAVEALAVWQLIARVRTRAELDRKIRTLQEAPPLPPPSEALPPPSPAGASLPPLPVQFSFAFRF